MTYCGFRMATGIEPFDALDVSFTKGARARRPGTLNIEGRLS
jgi:hypothetical protein